MTPAETAQQLVDLIILEGEIVDDDGRRILANQIAEAIEPWRAKAKPTEPEPLVPFTEAEARRFGSERVPFGAYRDHDWNTVPLDRLAWYADMARENWRNLWRYLNSPRVKREMESEG